MFGPVPMTTLYTPAGTPAAAAISASNRVFNGVISLGLCTTVQPATSAGMIFDIDSRSG